MSKGESTKKIGLNQKISVGMVGKSSWKSYKKRDTRSYLTGVGRRDWSWSSKAIRKV